MVSIGAKNLLFSPHVSPIFHLSCTAGHLFIDIHESSVESFGNDRVQDWVEDAIEEIKTT